MFVAIIIIFLLCVSFSFIEENMKRRDTLLLFMVIGLIMIVIAGIRVPGETPDSENYENNYYSITSLDSDDYLQEISFVYISYFLNVLGLSVNALFFAYALLSVPLRLTAIWKMSKLPILTLSIYISFYYQLHDLVQIRCAVASALFLLAVYYQTENNRKAALAFILLGTLFHYSALAGLIILLLNNKELNTWWQTGLYLVIPVAIIFYAAGLDIATMIPDELGGNRLKLYKSLKEYGIEGDLEGVAIYKNPMVLTNVCLYFFCLFFHKTLTEQCKYVPILLKIMAIAFLCRLTLDNISSVVSSRLFEYFDVVSIFLWTAVIYAFSPVNIGKIFTHTVSTARLLYSVLIYTLQL